MITPGSVVLFCACLSVHNLIFESFMSSLISLVVALFGGRRRSCLGDVAHCVGY